MNTDYPSGKAKLRFYPSSLQDFDMNSDVSMQMLYSNVKEHGMLDGYNIGAPLLIDNILKHLPGV